MSLSLTSLKLVAPPFVFGAVAIPPDPTRTVILRSRPIDVTLPERPISIIFRSRPMDVTLAEAHR